MTSLGWHASHEQISPSRLLAAAQLAEEVGFDAGMSSDHFSPWSSRQGESGFAWSWLGAALQATGLPFGVVNAPGQRYHPAIIAQAAATLVEMFPDRLWVALGTGEASNEHITGQRWPPKPNRERRAGEAVGLLHALFAYQGKKAFEGNPSPNLRVIATVFPYYIGWYVKKDAPYKKLADLKGKKGPVGLNANSAESTALSKDLKRRGWTFVGPTTVYAFMQAMGLVNDHLDGCFARPIVEAERTAFERPAA